VYHKIDAMSRIVTNENPITLNNNKEMIEIPTRITKEIYSLLSGTNSSASSLLFLFELIINPKAKIIITIENNCGQNFAMSGKLNAQMNVVTLNTIKIRPMILLVLFTQILLYLKRNIAPFNYSP